jgi:hypothetical protein
MQICEYSAPSRLFFSDFIAFEVVMLQQSNVLWYGDNIPGIPFEMIVEQLSIVRFRAASY